MHLYEHSLIPSASVCITAFQNSRPYAQPVLTDSYVLTFMQEQDSGMPVPAAEQTAESCGFLHIAEYLRYLHIP